MGVQVETRYRLKIGELFVKSVGRKGIELTINEGEAKSFVDDSEYCGNDNDYYSHEKQVFDTILAIGRHGIGSQSVKIIEYKVITEYVDREVELYTVGADLLKLRARLSGNIIGHLLDGDSDEV
jgi:hypothetical protein